MDETSADEWIGELIRDRYEYLGMSQADFSREAGLSDTVIREVVRGDLRRRRPKNLRNLSLALQWPPDSLAKLLDGSTLEDLDIGVTRPPAGASIADDRAMADRLSAVEDHLADMRKMLRAQGREIELHVASQLAKAGLEFAEGEQRGPDVSVTLPDGRTALIECKVASARGAVVGGVGELDFHSFDHPGALLLLAVLGPVTPRELDYAKEHDVEVVTGRSAVNVADQVIDRLVRVGAVAEHALAADADTVTGDQRRTRTKGPSPEPNE